MKSQIEIRLHCFEKCTLSSKPGFLKNAKCVSASWDEKVKGPKNDACEQLCKRTSRFWQNRTIQTGKLGLNVNWRKPWAPKYTRLLSRAPREDLIYSWKKKEKLSRCLAPCNGMPKWSHRYEPWLPLVAFGNRPPKQFTDKGETWECSCLERWTHVS